jgi:hypothetical protein
MIAYHAGQRDDRDPLTTALASAPLHEERPPWIRAYTISSHARWFVRWRHRNVSCSACEGRAVFAADVPHLARSGAPKPLLCLGCGWTSAPMSCRDRSWKTVEGQSWSPPHVAVLQLRRVLFRRRPLGMVA